ncbi:MAG: DUF2796 domain-containing protein [Pseudazoarcus pumilus]|nr:DUF2796 domain-containing protein [Pseudazoarcus pumilus]
MKIVSTSILAALAMSMASGASAQHAHEHGVAELRVALEGSTLLVEFESPLANLVGFEHAARSEAEKAALAGLEKTLRAPAGLFALPAAAGCALKEVELELPGVEDDHHHHGHDHKHDHKHAHHDDHADAYVAWEFACKSAPEALDLTVIEAFPAIHVLRVETAGPRGQKASRVEQAKARIAL